MNSEMSVMKLKALAFSVLVAAMSVTGCQQVPTAGAGTAGGGGGAGNGAAGGGYGTGGAGGLRQRRGWLRHGQRRSSTLPADLRNPSSILAQRIIYFDLRPLPTSARNT